MTKIVTGEFMVDFSTDNINELPEDFQIERKLTELFSVALDEYLYKVKVDTHEPYILSCSYLTVEDEE